MATRITVTVTSTINNNTWCWSYDDGLQGTGLAYLGEFLNRRTDLAITSMVVTEIEDVK
jgi:hypothetical protein